MRRVVAILFFFLLLVGHPFAVEKQTKGVLTPAQKSAVQAILTHEHLKEAKQSILVVSLKTGQTILSVNPNQMVIPASTQKVVSGAAALDTLKPHFRFQTPVYYDGVLLGDGTLKGNLYIKGGGDPSLVLEQTWLLAHQIRAYGVKTVTGNLVGDASFFDGTKHYKEWGKVGTRAYHAPMGALSVNFNTIGAYVAPGPQEGDPANATLDPATDLYQLDNRLITSAGGRTLVALSLTDRTCVVSGQIPQHVKGRTFYRSIADPLPYALAAIRAYLAQEGVSIGKETIQGKVPPNAKMLFTHESKPLSIILRDLYRSSNNFTAEQTARTMGATLYGEPGTQRKASEGITQWLRDHGFHQPGVFISDASGLSRENRINAKILVDVLRYMGNKPEVAAEFTDAMAVGGVDGTLKGRFRGTPLEGRVRAKSGLLWGVITLAGYCYDTNNDPYAFAVLINEYHRKASARQIQRHIERLLNKLME